MSDQQQVDSALSLEDLFLSHEFGRPRVHTGVYRPETTNGSVPPRGPLVPLAVTSVAGLVGHQTTTHLRRNRNLFAAVSSAAAALLVVAVVVAQPGRNAGRRTGGAGFSGSLAIGGGSVGATQTGSGSSTPTNVIGTETVGQAPGAATLAALNGNGTKGIVTRVGITTGCTSACAVIVPPPPPGGGKGGQSGGTGTTTPPPATSSTGGLLTPVVTLVGHAVSTVGNTAITAGQGLGVTLPAITPVTGLVGSLGGTLSGLGPSLAGTPV